MQRDAYIDFHLVPDHQLVMHDRLLNWARYVRVTPQLQQASIWRMGKSNARQWHEPAVGAPPDTLDGHAVEKAVSALPELHREALRWHYVFRSTPSAARRRLGVTNEGLQRLVIDGRSMLSNRHI